MKTKVWFVAMVAIVLLAGCAGAVPGMSSLATPALPDASLEGDPVEVPTLPDFLEMLAGPAGWVLLGAVLSDLYAKWSWYNAQSDAIKRGLILVVSAVIAIGARLLLTYIPATFWEATATYWYIIAGIVLTWIGSQGWFKTMVKPQREKERAALVLE